MVPGDRSDHAGAMNETTNAPGPGPRPGPDRQPSLPPHQDLGRLRRSTTDRYIAGVAGGLGRHFNVDPTVLRVLLVVLTFFGGAGLVLYVVCWLFVPEDTAEHAPVRVGAEPRKIVLLAAAAVAFLLAVGDAFSGFDAGWPIVGIAVVIAVVLIARDRRGDIVSGHDSGHATGPATGHDIAGSPAHAPTPGARTDPAQPVGQAASSPDPAYAAAQPPAWQPPIARPPLLPPRPRRTGIVWFWPTLALIAVGLGVLGIYDSNHVVADGAYPALALGITAVMLLVGSFVGRPGGLILLGFLTSVALAGSVVVGGAFGVDARDLHESPTTAAQVRDDYGTTVGQIRLDLTGVSDPEALAGRQIDLHLRTGHIEVLVPRTLNVAVAADVDVAGGISLPGNDGGGFNHSVQTYLTAVPASSSAPLELDIKAKFGQITVEYR
jgi:phage shock protein PspC (stress-responsive transcriptional regulator)